MVRNTLSLIMILLFLGSCTFLEKEFGIRIEQVDDGSQSNSSNSKPNDNFYARNDQSIDVRTSKTGLTASTGAANSREIVFSYFGQQERVYFNEDYHFNFRGIDLRDATLTTEISQSGGYLIVTVERKKGLEILLQSKCDVVEVRGVDQVPKIDIANDLSPEQIIITPLFDQNCNVIGYQIRYGSVSRGCASVASNVLERFNDCINKNRSSSKPTKKPKCLEEIWFGVPCP